MRDHETVWIFPVERIEKVVDGDTVDVLVDLGFSVFLSVRVRLAGINAPEVRGEERPQGLVSKEFVEKFVSDFDDKNVKFFLKSYLTKGKAKLGKYGRVLGDLVKVVETEQETQQYLLTEELLKAGLAVVENY